MSEEFLKFMDTQESIESRCDPYTTMETAWNAALEKACAVVFGYCDSDNVAQRTVNAIRKLKN